MRAEALALLVTVALLTVAAGSALGSPQTEAATCSYDEAELREYQPETSTDHLAVPPTASYGGIYSSPDRNTTVYVYFLYYPTQNGVTPVDSHDPDIEPVYVVVDEATGDIQRVQYSAYHYLKGAATPSELSMNGSNARLHVVEPWHHYRPTDARGSYVELENYCAVVDQWSESDWRAAPDAVTHPWTMTDRASWWEADSIRNRIAEEYREAQRSLDDVATEANWTVGQTDFG